MLSFIAGAIEGYSSFIQLERGWHASINKKWSAGVWEGHLYFGVDIILVKRLSKHIHHTCIFQVL